MNKTKNKMFQFKEGPMFIYWKHKQTINSAR